MKWRTSYFPEGGQFGYPEAVGTQAFALGMDESLGLLLDFARRALRMDVAFVSEFVGDEELLRAVVGDTSRVRIAVGDSVKLTDSYCKRVEIGLLPWVVCDVSNHPELLGLPHTKSFNVGSFVVVPILTVDGQSFGSLCCMSTCSDPSLRDEDAHVLEVLADFAAETLAGGEHGRRQREAATQAIEALMAPGGCRTVFQAIQDLYTGKTVGFEALSRFDGEISRNPEELFALAWQRGQGAELELHAVRSAVSAAESLPANTYLALNVSPDTIMSDDLLGALVGYPLDHVVLEITEHAVVRDYDQLSDALKPYRDRGLYLAIDDAGAGYASLRHILRLKPDAIKLDASLTRGIDSDPNLLALASALTSFGERIKATVVAEGVETQREANALRGLGIRFAQGFLIGKPLAPEMLGGALTQVDPILDVTA